MSFILYRRGRVRAFYQSCFIIYRYSVVLSEEGVDGRTFIAPFATRPGKWQIVRIPFTQFRPEVFNRAYNSGGDAEIDAVDPIDLNAIERVGIRYEARNQSQDTSTGGAPDWMTELDAPSNNGFELEMEYLKALPKGEETDFVLVSCGGAGLEDGEDRDKLVKVRVYFYLFPYKTPLMGNWTDDATCFVYRRNATASARFATAASGTPSSAPGSCSRSPAVTRRSCLTRVTGSPTTSPARTSLTCASR